MSSPILVQAQNLHRMAMAFQNPVQALLLKLRVGVANAHQLAPYVAVLAYMGHPLTVSQTPKHLLEHLGQARTLARIRFEPKTDSHADAAIADYQIVPASDQARREMQEYRNKHGLIAGVVSSKSTKKHPPRFGMAGQLNPWLTQG